MKIILVLGALINGQPHQTHIEMPTIENCTAEATKFLNYAMADKHSSKAVAACQIEVEDKPS